MCGLLDDLEFTAGDRGRVVRTALMAPTLLGRLQAAQAPSELREAVHAAPVEALALAVALAEQQGNGQAAQAAGWWISELRHVRLQITGDDLLAAGIPAGPEIGRRLALAMRTQARRRAGRRSRGGAGRSHGGAAGVGKSRRLMALRSRATGETEGAVSCELPGGGHALFTARARGNLSTMRGAGPRARPSGPR